jgi:peptidoglycan/LPS O-acetylase OafA/YrhL
VWECAKLPSSVRRIPQLDILRAVAVLIVIAYHYVPTPVARGGWVGVDIFFVLSGFLISGLLFDDIQKTGSISVGRFLVRRGFRIYPAFYFFLLLGWLIDPHRFTHSYAPEFLLVQNYLPRVWGHTWSLAVEEHFYIFLPFVLWLLARLNRLGTIPAIAGTLLIGCLGLRLMLVRQYLDFHSVTYPTHLRIDGLFLGVALSYIFRFRSEVWDRLDRWWLLPAGVGMLLPSMLLDRNNVFVLTAGLTLNAAASVCIIVWALNRQWLRANSIEQIGRHSYSIYLWQPIAIAFCSSKNLTLPNMAFCAFACIVIGITMATMVEIPALALRDKLFPTQQRDRTRRPVLVPLGREAV